MNRNLPTANGLTQAIIKWLHMHGSWATRISSAGRYLPKAGRFIPSTTSKGTADIHAVMYGRHISIEVKIGNDRMSEAQKETQRAIEASGGIYYVATDFDSFIEWHRKTLDSFASSSMRTGETEIGRGTNSRNRWKFRLK